MEHHRKRSQSIPERAGVWKTEKTTGNRYQASKGATIGINRKYQPKQIKKGLLESGGRVCRGLIVLSS